MTTLLEQHFDKLFIRVNGRIIYTCYTRPLTNNVDILQSLLLIDSRSSRLAIQSLCQGQIDVGITIENGVYLATSAIAKQVGIVAIFHGDGAEVEIRIIASLYEFAGLVARVFGQKVGAAHVVCFKTVVEMPSTRQTMVAAFHTIASKIRWQYKHVPVIPAYHFGINGQGKDDFLISFSLSANLKHPCITRLQLITKGRLYQFTG